MDDLHSRLRGRRKAMQLTQRELAERSGVHQGHISNVESGARGLSHDAIRAVARALNVSVAYLLGDTNQSRVSDAQRELQNDTATPEGLRALASDTHLADALAVTEEEWRMLARLELPQPITKDGYTQLLITIRAISNT